MYVCIVIYSGRPQVDASSGVTQEKNHTRFLHLPSAVRALIFIARRIQPSLSLVNREIDFEDTYVLSKQAASASPSTLIIIPGSIYRNRPWNKL